MLTKKQRRAVVQRFVRAYETYRDMPLRAVCKKEGLFVRKQFDDEFGGCLQVRTIEVPGRAPRDGKELVFWHEFGHWLLKGVLHYPRLIGYQGFLQQGEETYWIHERLCEAFADIMILYRRGLAELSPEQVESLLFEDTAAIGYAEVIRATERRISEHYNKALASGRNIDLSSTKTLLRWLECGIHHAAFQPLLPTQFRDCHQTPWVSYVDERHWDKPSWKYRHLQEHKFLAEIESLKAFRAQPRLFDSMTEADRNEFARRLERLDRKAKRFQKS